MTQNTEGYGVIPRHLLYDPEVPVQAKMTYLMISSYVGTADTAWPSHATLAEQSGLSVNSIKRALNWLRDHGYVTWTTRRREDGGQSSNLYRLTDPEAPKGTPPDQSGPPPGSGGPAPGSRGADERISVERASVERPQRTYSRATTVPDLFPITDRMQDWARTNAAGINLTAETEQWRDHHRAKGDTAKDWTASWRTWMRNAVKFNRGRPAVASNGAVPYRDADHWEGRR